MSATIAIEGRVIGATTQPYVIAEIGVNHDGDVQRGRELVHAARDAGADAVKFQLFDADLLMSADGLLAAYQSSSGATDPRAMLRELQLSPRAMGELCAEARRFGLHPVVTVFSAPLVAEAETMHVAAYKSASPDIVNRPLLDAMCATGRPLIVSTGAADLDEVRRAAGWLAGRAIAWLQCVSSYPTPPEHASLRGIVDLARVTGGVVGYSDHTGDIETGGLAVAAGAAILEKHLTYDRRARGPDHEASLDPQQFAAYVRGVRRAAAMMGTGKHVLHIERDVRHVSRQSLVAARDLKRGDRISAADLTVKRPGSGIAPWRLDEIIGRTMTRDLGCDRVLTEDCVT